MSESRERKEAGAIVVIYPIGIESDNGPFLGRFIEGVKPDMPKEELLPRLAEAFIDVFKTAKRGQLIPYRYTFFFFDGGEIRSFPHEELVPYIVKREPEDVSISV